MRKQQASLRKQLANKEDDLWDGRVSSIEQVTRSALQGEVDCSITAASADQSNGFLPLVPLPSALFAAAAKLKAADC